MKTKGGLAHRCESKLHQGLLVYLRDLLFRPIISGSVGIDCLVEHRLAMSGWGRRILRETGSNSRNIVDNAVVADRGRFSGGSASYGPTHGRQLHGNCEYVWWQEGTDCGGMLGK